jgi:hypothetical protein
VASSGMMAIPISFNPLKMMTVVVEEQEQTNRLDNAIRLSFLKKYLNKDKNLIWFLIQVAEQ